MVNEYYAIKHFSGLGYKLYSVIKLMTLEGKTDNDGYVCLSYNAIANKIGISKPNVARVIRDIEKFPEVIEVIRAASRINYVTRFRVNPDLLR